MPSTEEAFGVAYVEAMAGGVPAIGCRGEPGPEEIAAAGDGFLLVPPGDIERLTQRIDELLVRPAPAARGRAARTRDRRRATSPGSAAASRPSPPTSTRSAVKPVLFVTGTRPAYRVGAFARAARAREHRARAVRRALAARRRRTSSGELPFPHRHVRPRELPGLAASGALPRGRLPHRRAPRAARRAGRGARRARAPADPVGVAVGAPAQRSRTRSATLPLRRLYRARRRGRDVRAARERVRSCARRAQRARRAAVGRQRLLALAERPGAPQRPALARRRAVQVPVRRPCRRARRAWTVLLVRPGGAAASVADEAALVLAAAPASSRRRSGRRPSEARRSCASTRSSRRLRDVYAACDVLVVPSIATAHLPRALGVGCQRGDEPRAAGDRHRCGRRRRRRARARRRNGLVVPAGDAAALAARDPAAGRRCGAARAAGRARRARTCSPTPTTRGPRASRARSPASASPASAGSVDVPADERPSRSRTIGARPPSRCCWRCCLRGALTSARRRASADIGETIILRCTHGQSLSGFSQSAYSEALKELNADTEEYTDCAQLIRQAQLPRRAPARGRPTAHGRGAPSPPRRPSSRPSRTRPQRRRGARPASAASSIQPGRRPRQHRLGVQLAADARCSRPLAFLLACLVAVRRRRPCETASVAAAPS